MEINKAGGKQNSDGIFMSKKALEKSPLWMKNLWIMWISLLITRQNWFPWCG